MKIILLSGGSGTRLWPLSNDSRAKQFLQVLRNEETGELESMLQRVYRLLLRVVRAEDIIITSNKLQVEMIRKQIGNISIVVEPERRDTFPAIALASVYLISELGVSADEVVGVVSVDTFVDFKFYQKVIELEYFVRSSNAQLGLVGIKPTYNSSKYGYILPRVWQNDIMEVASFIEKPSEEEAETLIENSAYWNSGVFVFSLSLILNKIQQLNIPINYNGVFKRFRELPKKSFDYELVEHLTHIIASTYDGYWKDLGTWNTLTEEMSQQVIGNGGLSDDCQNTHIVNELDLPVKVLGISNAVVAVSADGILVTDKPSSSRMKDMLHEGLFSMPMYEEREWGWYRIIDFVRTDERETLTKRIFIEAGKRLNVRLSGECTEVWTVISGNVEIAVNESKQYVKAGHVIHISDNAQYTIHAVEAAEIIAVQMSELSQESLYVN